MTRKVSRILKYLSVSVLLLLVAAAGFTQTTLFRQSLRSTLYKLVASNLNASVYIGEIHGNLITGISIDTLAMYVNNASFVEARNLSVRYDPLPLWGKRVAVASVEIVDPSITLIRFSDSTWNIDRLSKKKAESDTLPSEWSVDVSSLRLKNAHFRLIDSTSTARAEQPDSTGRRTFVFSDLDIRKLNVELSGSIAGKEQSVSVKNISFESPREGFSLSKFSADFRHTPSKTELRNLLASTPRSHIELSAKVTGVDAFKVKDLAPLQFVSTECAFTSTTIASDDLQRFLPSLGFLKGSVKLDCAVEGQFGNLLVKKLQASFNHSTIILAGTVSNLHRPKDLTLNVESKGTLIAPSDVPAILPYFHIPDYGSAGPLALDFHYVGRPLDFQVQAHASLPSGILTVDGALDLTGEVMKYRGVFGGKGVDVGRILSAPSLRSHLDFSGSVEGQGTSIDNFDSKLTVDLDSSQFAGIPVSQLRTTIVAAHNALSINANGRFQRGEVTFTSALSYSNPGGPSYSVTGVVSQFDLATFFHDEHYSSECSFTFDARGKNFLNETMTGDLRLAFSPSKFLSYAFDTAQAEIHVRFDSLGHRTVRIASPVADGSLEGTFTFGGLAGMIRSHVGGFRNAYEIQRAVFDSTFIASPVDTVSAADTARVHPSEKSDIHYSFQLKNLEPLAIFLGTPLFNATGSVEGVLQGNEDSLSAEGSVAIRSGKFSLKNDIVLVEGCSLSYDFRHMTHDSLLAEMNGPTMSMRLSAANVFVGSSYFRNAAVDFLFHNRKATYAVKAEKDSTIRLIVDGRAAISPQEYQFTFDNFSLRYQGYELNNVNQFFARLNSAGFAIDSTSFIHQDELLTLGGSVNYGGDINAFVRLHNFTLSNIHYFGGSPDFRSSALLFGGTVDVRGVVSGAMADPVIVGRLSATNVSFRGTEFGFISGTANYANKNAAISIQLSHGLQGGGETELSCTGSIPMDLAFSHVEHRLGLPGMEMELKANGFNISIIDPFIAEVDEMKGTLDGSIHCTGSLESPLFDGSMEFQNGEFLFPMNSMRYQAVGKIELKENRLSLSALSIKNLYEDFSSGKMDFGGYIALRGFVPDQYHLSAKGELMVLQKTSLNSNQGVYGDVTASTGPDGLLFDGTYASSRLTGTIFLKQASLTFPPTRQSANLYSTRFVNEMIVDDTSKQVPESFLGPNLLSLFRPKGDQRSGNETSFLDGLGYDLVIQTQGIVQVRMVFNAATGEELFADLNGKLTLSKEGSNVRLTGTINVSEKSSYKFYKQFDASGTLTFTGRPDNPQLDIKATYRGTHVKVDLTAPKGQDVAQKETAPAQTEKVLVSLAITGTRYDPKIKIGLSIIDDNGNETERSGDVESDAISFLLTSTPSQSGKFREDLTNLDKQSIANSIGGPVGGSLISGFANSLLSGMMLDFLRANNINAVSNVEIQYSGGPPDLRISGAVGDAYWTFGGKVFNDINNANISLQWSLGSIVQSDRLRNFMFEVNRKTDAFETSDFRRPTNGARIYYKFVF